MPQLEPLHLKLTGSAEGLTATLGKTQGDLSRFGSQVNTLSSKFSGLANPVTLAFGAIVAGAGAAAIAIGRIREAMNQIDDTNDAAARLGVTFSELKGLRLSLGEATGIDTEAIDSAIIKMQVSLGEAARDGSSKASQALAELGLNAEKLIAGGPQRAIEMLAEKISKVQSRSEQLQLIFDILGKSGLSLAAALRESPEGLREAAEWAEKNLSLTTQQVNQVAMANDAWDRVGLAIQNILQRLAAEVSPLLQVIAEDVLGVAANFDGVDESVRGATESLAQMYGFIADIKDLAVKPFETVGNLAQFKFSAAGQSIVDLVNFDQAEKYLDRVREIRDKAAGGTSKTIPGYDEPADRRQVSEVEALRIESKAAALESEKKALQDTKAAADSVSAKANEVQSIVEAIKPKALSAVTDRAEQLRRIGELEAKKTKDTQAERLNDKVLGKLDRLIDVVRNSGDGPAINLD